MALQNMPRTVWLLGARRSVDFLIPGLLLIVSSQIVCLCLPEVMLVLDENYFQMSFCYLLCFFFFRRREIAERERRERERIRIMHEREECLQRERERLEIERQKLERERMERERLERERVRIEQVLHSSQKIQICLS